MHDLHYSTDGFVLFCLVLLHPHIKTTKDCRMSAFLFFLLTFLCWTSNIPWTSLLDFLMERRLLLKTRRVENLTVGIFEKVSAFYAVVSSRKTNTLFINLESHAQRPTKQWLLFRRLLFLIWWHHRRRISKAIRVSCFF